MGNILTKILAILAVALGVFGFAFGRSTKGKEIELEHYKSDKETNQRIDSVSIPSDHVDVINELRRLGNK